MCTNLAGMLKSCGSRGGEISSDGLRSGITIIVEFEVDDRHFGAPCGTIELYYRRSRTNIHIPSQRVLAFLQ